MWIALDWMPRSAFSVLAHDRGFDHDVDSISRKKKGDGGTDGDRPTGDWRWEIPPP